MDMGNWDAAIAATLSGAVTAAVARAYIAKTIKDLEIVIEKIGEVRTEIAKIIVKLDHLDEAADLVTKHDRKIAAMEEKLYGYKRPQFPS